MTPIDRQVRVQLLQLEASVRGVGKGTEPQAASWMEAYGDHPRGAREGGAGPWKQSLPFTASHKTAGRLQGSTARGTQTPHTATPTRPLQLSSSLTEEKLLGPEPMAKQRTRAQRRQSGGGGPSGATGPRAVAAVPAVQGLSPPPSLQQAREDPFRCPILFQKPQPTVLGNPSRAPSSPCQPPED